MSYRDVVKPKSRCTEEDEQEYVEDDDWDGCLVTSKLEEMARGITVKETEEGLHINFSEEERKRMGRKWQNSLIIKLLGGSVGYMYLKRRLQTLWGIT